jgi:DNA/RNA-binding domain of Phe-tRNA-synthetase-like protein
MFQVTEEWKTTYPGAIMGVLAMDSVSNPAQHAGLEALKTDFEAKARAEYASYTRRMLEDLPAVHPYVAYYKRFNKSYHVLFQIESVAQKGKGLPHVAALVEAMFMAELKNQLLTAGHDLDLLQLPLKLDAARGTESYTQMSGQEQILKTGDMFVSDEKGVISSIIYGPDRRTAINAETKRVIFTVYAPPGVGPERMRLHLKDISDYVLLISPQATIRLMELYQA